MEERILYFKIKHLKEALDVLMPEGCSPYMARKIFNKYKKKYIDSGGEQYNIQFLPTEWFAEQYAIDQKVDKNLIIDSIHKKQNENKRV